MNNIFKKIKRKCLIYAILRILVPIISIVVCFLVTAFADQTTSLLLTIIFAILAVSSYIFLTNRYKGNQLYLEDEIFNEALKGLYDKKKTANARSYLNINELVKNNLFIEPYRRYGFLYYEVMYNRVIIDSSNLTLEYLEDSTKKRKKTYYGFLGRAIRYELRSHKPLYLVNKKSKYFNVSESIVEDDVFNVSGNLNNYERINKNGALDKLKDYIKNNNDFVLSVFYLPEAIYVLIEDEVITINPKFKDKIDDEYINNYKIKFRVPRDIADILKITK